MRPEFDKYVWHANESTRRILRFTPGKSMDEYRNDEMLTVVPATRVVDLPGAVTQCYCHH
jgi:hypothetical protein